MTGSGSKGGKAPALSLIRRSEDIIKSFNPVTHSIDTHLIDVLGSESGWGNDEWFIQQTVTGWYREKKTLDAFISNMYADNGARITRTDMMLYTILSYLAIFRLKELGFSRFKELCSSEDPSKIAFTEDVLIANCEHFIPNVQRYIEELDGAAVGLAAAEAAKEEEKKQGTAGMGAVLRKQSTRPVSPKLTRPRPPILPQPEKIDGDVTAKEVPGYLNNITLDKLDATRKETRAKVKAETLNKYATTKPFQFSTTTRGKPIEEIRAEIEAERAKELRFDASFVHDVPDFNQSKAVVRVNAATILREDYLYRKQQSKDSAVLKAYEEDLRDPVEFFAWQQKMKEGDEKAKVENVVLRRTQAKQSSEEAARANEKLLADNQRIAKLIRTRGTAIAEKRDVERELDLMKKQITRSKIAEKRDHNPGAAVERVSKQKKAEAAVARVELKSLLEAKKQQDVVDEEVQMDKIRQLRAINDVHKSTIKVFDPTEVSGMSFLNNMSYMEMQERVITQKAKQENTEMNKRADILEAKQKRAKDLKNRADSVLRARQVKANAFKSYYAEKRLKEATVKEHKESLRETAAIALERELRESRAKKQEAAAALLAEQERIKRAQAYLGAAAGQKEETLELQLRMARERAIENRQVVYRKESQLEQEVKAKEKSNRLYVHKVAAKENAAINAARDAETLIDRRVAVEKIKADTMHKKATAAGSRAQARKTHTVRVEYNPYAEDMRRESVELARTFKETGRRYLTGSA
eukprot:GSChrysophyteH1.ASY1.ANO1.2383.1 assembled CDS